LIFFDFFGQLSYKIIFFSLVLFIPQNNAVQSSAPIVHSENLIAIKEILYVEYPLLLILAVIGLLIALFGVTSVAFEDRKVFLNAPV
jgi:hypothetical protein